VPPLDDVLPPDDMPPELELLDPDEDEEELPLEPEELLELPLPGDWLRDSVPFIPASLDFEFSTCMDVPPPCWLMQLCSSAADPAPKAEHIRRRTKSLLLPVMIAPGAS